MKRLFSLVIFFIACAHMNPISADEVEGDYNPKNYLYDEEGNCSFVKVYIDKIDSRHGFDCLAQRDGRGSFLAIPIQRFLSKEKPKGWDCPYCGRRNPAERNTCSNPDCVLYRKPPRDW